MNYNQGGYYDGGQNGGYGQNSFYGGGMYVPPGKKLPHFVAHETWQREKLTLRRLSMMAGGGIILFLILSTVYVLVFQNIISLLKNNGVMSADALNAITSSAEFNYLFEIIYSVFVVGGPFFIIGAVAHRYGFIASVPLGKSKNAKYLPIIVLGAFGVCLLGNIATAYIDSIIEAITGFEITMPEMPSPPKSFLGIFLYFLSSAAVPALVEEMIMRGIVMQPLRRYGDWFAIFASSVIFGLMHCNLMQIPFAFIAGIAIGYAVIATNSIWTGVLIHFCNNAFSVAVSVVMNFYGEDSTQYAICNVVFYVLIIIGVACAVMFVSKLNDTEMKTSPLINQGRRFIGQPHPFSAKISNGKLFGTYVATVPMIAALVFVVYQTVVALVML